MTNIVELQSNFQIVTFADRATEALAVSPWYSAAYMGFAMLLMVAFISVMAIVLTPLLYLAHGLIDTYLGEDLSLEMRQEAMEN